MRIDREYFIRFAVAVALACYDLPTDRAMTSEEAAQLVKWVIDMALGHDASNVQVEPIFGFRLYDKVLYQGGECFVWGRRRSGSFLLRTIDGTKVKDGVGYRNLTLLERSTNYLIA